MKQKPTGLEGVHAKIKKLQKNMDEKVQVGYRKSTAKRKEGETWVDESGTTWTVKNGIEQNVPKLSEAKLPWWCPKCEKMMNDKMDTKTFYLRGTCYNCELKREDEMRLAGTWNEYRMKQKIENEKAFLRDEIQKKEDYLRTFTTPKLYFGDGRYEEVEDIHKFEDEFARLKLDIEFMKNQLQYVETLTVNTDGSISDVDGKIVYVVK